MFSQKTDCFFSKFYVFYRFEKYLSSKNLPKFAFPGKIHRNLAKTRPNLQIA